MPSALETMVKILKLERDQGAKNTAVVGGLAEICKSWESQARQEARRPAHHILIDEIIDNLVSYDTILEESERTTKLSYLLDRITNRVPAPQEYADRLPDWTEKLKQETQKLSTGVQRAATTATFRSAASATSAFKKTWFSSVKARFRR